MVADRTTLVIGHVNELHAAKLATSAFLAELNPVHLSSRDKTSRSAMKVGCKGVRNPTWKLTTIASLAFVHEHNLAATLTEEQ